MELSDLVVSAQEAFSHPGVRCCIYAGLNAGIAYYNRNNWSEGKLVGAISFTTVLAMIEVPLSYQKELLFDNPYLHVGSIHLLGLSAQMLSYVRQDNIRNKNNELKKENNEKKNLIPLHSSLYPRLRQQSSDD